MPRTSQPLAAVRGRVGRVTRLDACGRVVVGEYNQGVSEGIITAAFTANTVETEAIDVKNFGGKRCVYEPGKTDLAGYGVVLTFCKVDFEFFEIITKQTLVFDAFGAVVGIEADTKISLDDEGFALEIWTGSEGTDVCENPDAQGSWGYLLLPLIKGGILGDFTVEDGAVNFTITGANTRDGNSWGNGPYAVELDADGNPAPLFQAVSKTSPYRMQVVTVAPPEPTAGARPVLLPTLPDLASLAAVEGDVPMEAEFATTPAATGPVWYDFGDGEWDYVTAPGDASHTYATPGTYTVLASQNGTSWTTATVVVPFA